MFASEAYVPKGLTYFWFLNDDLRLDVLRRQIRAFADGGTDTLVLHPRIGLLLPFASSDWFELIRTLVRDVADAGMKSWLYDEDYCPSGQAGGLLLNERQEFEAYSIDRHEADAALKPGDLFTFPMGKLIWAGYVSDDASQPATDMTKHVGAIRTHWEASEWDSRWYYANTPLYDCPRSGAYVPEFAVRLPKAKEGGRFVAFIAKPSGRSSAYGGLVDSLNPDATQELLRVAYDPYIDYLGDAIGRDVTAVFTDEPKYFGSFPWTGDLFEKFEKQFGYDLRSRLDHLFRFRDDPAAMLTRLHYRQWLGTRFAEAWLEPVADWCHRHGLPLVGHMSPEDDAPHQASTLSNLFPLQKHLDLPGLDLIIPAVGDHEHPMINVGVTTGASCAQQQDKPTAMSEILGASGNTLTGAGAARVLGWQIMSGVGAPVVHAAFASKLGLRYLDAPPDCGPDGPRWPAMAESSVALRPFIDAVTDSTQDAPVAILWPARSCCADTIQPFHADHPLRNSVEQILLACLESQVGAHLIDEDDLQAATITDGAITLGRATYKHLLLPMTTVLRGETISQLSAVRDGGVSVHLLGEPPQWDEHDGELKTRTQAPWDDARAGDLPTWCATNLPRLVGAPTDTVRDLRMTAWNKDGKRITLCMNLGDVEARIGDAALNAGAMLRLDDGEVVHRFDPAALPADLPAPPAPPLTDWQMKFGDEPWNAVEQPVAVYRVGGKGISGQMINMTLTGLSAHGGPAVTTEVSYRATIGDMNGNTEATLRLEPSAARGDITITLGDKQWHATLSDLDVQPVDIDLSEGLASGARELTMTFSEPTSYDGLHVAPVVLSRK